MWRGIWGIDRTQLELFRAEELDKRGADFRNRELYRDANHHHKARHKGGKEMRFRTIVIAILIGLTLVGIGFLIGRDAVPPEIIGDAAYYEIP